MSNNDLLFCPKKNPDAIIRLNGTPLSILKQPELLALSLSAAKIT